MTLDTVQSATNFCNVNENGNANNWNASNVIGVRPDFTTVHLSDWLLRTAMGKEESSLRQILPINTNHNAAGYDRSRYRVVHVFKIMNKLFDANLIYEAGTKAMQGSRFKYKTQLYEMTQLLQTAHIQQDLMQGTYTPAPGVKFPINERGHSRYITSNIMRDKTVNHLLCDEVISPSIRRYLAHTNSASQKGKGVSFHRRHFEEDLHHYYMQHGTNEGWVLFVDFSGYYGNIRHEPIIATLEEFIRREQDPEVAATAMGLIRKIFTTFEMDVSRFSDEEIEELYYGKVDPMMNRFTDPKLLTGEKMLRKGVDIGNQVSQDVGIVHPYRIDNYISIVMGCHLFGRYTDDTHIISDSKEELLTVLEGVKRIADKYGIIINEKKTRICKLSDFYRYLQIGYSMTDTGRLIRKINPKNVTRERHKLKAYKRKLDAGKMTYEDVENSFKSWLGGNWKRMSMQQISNMSLLYYQLFERRPTWKKGHGRLRWLMGQPWRGSTSTATTTSAAQSSQRKPSRATSAL